MNSTESFEYDITYSKKTIFVSAEKHITLYFTGMPTVEEVKEKLIELRKIEREDYYSINISIKKLDHAESHKLSKVTGLWRDIVDRFSNSSGIS